MYGVNASIQQWAEGTELWQIQYVGALVEAGNNTGVRCPGRSLTVGFIRHELFTRANQGRFALDDSVYDRVNEILFENGCGYDTASGFVPMTKPVIRRFTSGTVGVPNSQAPLEKIDAEAILKQF